MTRTCASRYFCSPELAPWAIFAHFFLLLLSRYVHVLASATAPAIFSFLFLLLSFIFLQLSYYHRVDDMTGPE